MILKNEKVLIVDIDGVLNCYRDFFAESYYDKKDWNAEGVNTLIFNKGCLALLEHVIDETDAKIVFSSNRRRTHTIDEIYQHMVDHGFSKPRSIISDEYPSFKFTSQRGHEVNWFVNDYELENFFIIDDIDCYLSKFFVEYKRDTFEDQPDATYLRINHECGLVETDARIIINHLGRTPEREAVHEAAMKQRKADLDLLIGCMV